MLEVRFHGRGGQGAYLASWILASAIFKENYWTHAFPRFGAERRGAEIEAFLRISRNKISVRSIVYNPDIVMVFDPKLAKSKSVLEGLKKNGLVIINSSNSLEEIFPEGIPQTVFIFDANSIALKHGLGTPTSPIANTAMLGVFAAVTGLVKIESILESLKERGPQQLKENEKALNEAYEKALSLITQKVVLEV